MGLKNRIDLFLAKFGILNSNNIKGYDISPLYQGVRFNPKSVITEKSAGIIYFDIAFNNVLQLYQPNMLFDVGANSGQFRNKIRTIGYQGKIISFEPQPGPFFDSKKVEDDNWVRLNFGLGNVKSKVLMDYYNESTFSSIKQMDDNALKDLGIIDVKREGQIEIDVFRLDDLDGSVFDLKDLKNAILKTDTQGFDFEVLLGAEKVLSKTSAIIVETSNSFLYKDSKSQKQTLELLQNAGFTIRAVSPVAFDRNNNLAELDILMVK